MNGGTCSAPNTCTCAPGWIGEQCTRGEYIYCAKTTALHCGPLDINECLQPNPPCEHTCTNTQGSYVCSCDPGYTLNRDNCEGKQCNNSVNIFYVATDSVCLSIYLISHVRTTVFACMHA